MQREIVRVGDLQVHGSVPHCCPFWPTALPCASTFSYTPLRSMSCATKILMTEPWFEYAVGGMLVVLRNVWAPTSCGALELLENVIWLPLPLALFASAWPKSPIRLTISAP